MALLPLLPRPTVEVRKREPNFRTFAPPKRNAIKQQIAPEQNTPEQNALSDLMYVLSLTPASLAELTDTHVTSVYRWISGRTPVPKLVLSHLQLLRKSP